MNKFRSYPRCNQDIFAVDKEWQNVVVLKTGGQNPLDTFMLPHWEVQLFIKDIIAGLLPYKYTGNKVGFQHPVKIALKKFLKSVFIYLNTVLLKKSIIK